MISLSELLFKKLYRAVLNSWAENSRVINESLKLNKELSKVNTKLVAILQEERQQNKELFDNLIMTMLISPREGMEALLRHFERQEK